jgi:hypothetical protein
VCVEQTLGTSQGTPVGQCLVRWMERWPGALTALVFDLEPILLFPLHPLSLYSEKSIS